MYFLRSSIIFMRWDFRSESCFSGVLAYPGFAVLGELGFNVAMLHRLLLLILLSLSLAICLSLVLTVLAVSDWSLSVLVGRESSVTWI